LKAEYNNLPVHLTVDRIVLAFDLKAEYNNLPVHLTVDRIVLAFDLKAKLKLK